MFAFLNEPPGTKLEQPPYLNLEAMELGGMVTQSEPLEEYATSDLARRILAGIPIAAIWGIIIYISFLHYTIKAMP
jgi:hypothetical protein